jgi:hypothetical protein
VDADTARFTIGGTWSTGQVTVQMTGLWPKDLAGNSLASYTTGDFEISDPTRPAPTFTTPQAFTTGDNPQSLAAGDLNGDGKLDLVTANKDSSTVSFLVNTTPVGATAPSFSVKQDFATVIDARPFGIALSDLDRNGRLDLIVSNSNSNTISVFRNTTAVGATPLSFAARQDFVVGNHPHQIAVGDFNGDNRPDLAVSNDSLVLAGSVSVLLNTTLPGPGILSFAAQREFPTGEFPEAIAIGDLNGDSRPDIIVATILTGVSVLRNTTLSGDAIPSFAARESFSSGDFTSSIALTDINADNRLDIVTANKKFAPDGVVNVLLNTTSLGMSTMSFATRQSFLVGNYPYSVATGDFNGDNKPDLVAANLFGSNVSVLTNTTVAEAATSSFAIKRDFDTETIPYSIALGDFNGDSKLDLATANGFRNVVSVLLNTTPISSSARTAAAHTTESVAALRLLNPTSAHAANGIITSSLTSSLGNSPVFSAGGDLNRDGKPDIVAANEFGHKVSVLTNQTARGATTVTFATQQMFDTGTGASAVALADSNGDSRTDLAVTNDGAKTVSILLNTTTISTTAAASRSAQARRVDLQVLDSVWSDRIMSLALIDLFASDSRNP